MWGAKLYQRRDLIEGLVRAMIVAGQDQNKSTDQNTQELILWPTAKYHVVGSCLRKCCSLLFSIVRTFIPKCLT